MCPQWTAQLAENPQQAVADLLRGCAPIYPFERLAPHEFLLELLPGACKRVQSRRLAGPQGAPEPLAQLALHVDTGLAAWLLTQRQAPVPTVKLEAYAARVCEALQWPLYFDLPKTCGVLQADQAAWLQWLCPLTQSRLRDPEADYWQVLQANNHV